MQWVYISVFVACAALFMTAFSAAIYVAYRFLAVIVTLDAAMSRSRALTAELKNPVLFPSNHTQPESQDGTAEPYDEEALYIAEAVRKVRGQDGLSDEELQKFIAGARGVDLEHNKGE